jgi:hypothetical protein
MGRAHTSRGLSLFTHTHTCRQGSGPQDRQGRQKRLCWGETAKSELARTSTDDEECPNKDILQFGYCRMPNTAAVCVSYFVHTIFTPY